MIVQRSTVVGAIDKDPVNHLQDGAWALTTRELNLYGDAFSEFSFTIWAIGINFGENVDKIKVIY